MKAICKDFPHTMQVLGPSGSGKDTQIDKLVELCGYVKIGTGDMFRVLYEEGTEDGKRAFEYWGKGKWVPDDLTYKLFQEWLQKFDKGDPWIFSQVVRAPGQVELFDGLLERFDRKLDVVIYFSLSEEAAIERMSLRRHCPKCKREYHLKYLKPKHDEVCDDDGTKLIPREDDHPDAIRSRLTEFNEKTRPVLKKYRERGILIEVDAGPSIDEIHEEVVSVLREWVAE